MSAILFRINAKGNVNIEVSGVQGASCQQLTAAFEEALGTKVDTQLKPDFEVVLDGLTTSVTEGEE